MPSNRILGLFSQPANTHVPTSILSAPGSVNLRSPVGVGVGVVAVAFGIGCGEVVDVDAFCAVAGVAGGGADVGVGVGVGCVGSLVVEVVGVVGVLVAMAGFVVAG